MIDLLTARQPWSDRQIQKCADKQIRTVFRADDEAALNRRLHGVTHNDYPMSVNETNIFTGFAYCAFNAKDMIAALKADNEKLILVLAHEKAIKDKAALELRINGRDEVQAVAEVPEEVDPETGEVTQTFVPAVLYQSEILPLAETIDTVDDSGDPVTVANPQYTKAVADLAAAQAVIEGASADTLALFGLREANRNAE